MELAVIAYNHFEGGGDRDPHGAVRFDRLRAQLEMLAEHQPDVLISTEGRYWLDPMDRTPLTMGQSTLGLFPYVAPAPRHDCHVVIWVNPAKLTGVRQYHETHFPFWHAQARISADVAGLHGPLWIFGAHFSPSVPGIRFMEAKATGDLADGRHVLGGGDFNDDAAHDLVPSRAMMPPYKRERHLPAGSENASTVLERVGLRDVAELAHPRAEHEPTAGFKHEAPLRCDRQHAGPSLHRAVTHYERLPFDPALSDHCPVLARYDLSRVG